MKRENQNLFFENKELFVGIDVHKAKWVVTVRTYDLELKTFSMQPIAEVLDKLLRTNYPGAICKIVYECCLSGFWIYDYFSEKDYQIIVTPTIRVYKDGALLDKFERVYRSSGSKQKAIVAVARKLMTKLYAVIIKEEQYIINKAA